MILKKGLRSSTNSFVSFFTSGNALDVISQVQRRTAEDFCGHKCYLQNEEVTMADIERKNFYPKCTLNVGTK